jgi:branched-chain amino acid transport system permease protein
MELAHISTILIMGLTIGCIYAVIAVGLNLLYGTMRMLNVAHGTLIMLGAYLAYWLFTKYNISPLISAIIAAVGGTIIGLIVYKLLFSSSIRTAKSLESLEGTSLLIFFGLLILFENIALLSWGADFRGYSYLRRPVEILGTTLALNRLSAALIAIVVCLAFYIFLQRTLFGKAVRAVIQDKDATQLVGIDTGKVYMFCFGVAFGMAALAGALVSMFYAITPFIGLPYTLMAFVVIILGGLGNILGSLVGGLILGLIITTVVALTSPGFGPIIQYLILILVIYFMPQGIFGRRIR